jgi:hypothetical protein
VAASAYSTFRPFDPANTEEAYRRNRRIDIAVVAKDDNIRKIVDTMPRTRRSRMRENPRCLDRD